METIPEMLEEEVIEEVARGWGVGKWLLSLSTPILELPGQIDELRLAVLAERIERAFGIPEIIDLTSGGIRTIGDIVSVVQRYRS